MVRRLLAGRREPVSREAPPGVVDGGPGAGGLAESAGRRGHGGGHRRVLRGQLQIRGERGAQALAESGRGGVAREIGGEGWVHGGEGTRPS